MKAPRNWMTLVLANMNQKRKYNFGDPFDGHMCSHVGTLEIVDVGGKMVSRELPSIDVPDGWFELIHDDRRALGRERGSLHLARAGWEANKDEIKSRFEGDATEWAWVERVMTASFDNVDKKTDRRKAYLAKIAS